VPSGITVVAILQIVVADIVAERSGARVEVGPGRTIYRAPTPDSSWIAA
jgi:hypothetical protein